MKLWNCICVTVFAVLLVVVVSCGTPSNEIAFYVSPEGDDASKGNSPKHPFATIIRARDAVRELKVAERIDKPVTVYIMGGTYELSGPIVFTPEDSGSKEFPITYCGYQDQRPVISGGRHITGWTKRSDGVWTVTVPEAKNGAWQFRQLFVNGERRTRARTPNAGEYFKVNGRVHCDNDGSSSSGDLAVLPYHEGDIDPAWKNKGDVEIVSLNHWAQFKLIIKDVETNAKTVTLSRNCQKLHIEGNARYWIENTMDACDTSGEWYLDFDTGEVIYRPMPGEDMSEAKVIAPLLTELLRFEGVPEQEQYVTNLVLRDLDFAYTDWTMPRYEGYVDFHAANEVPGIIRGDGVMNVTIDGCLVAHHGNYGIEFARGCSNVRIIGNTIHDIGAGGLKIGEKINRENVAEQTHHIEVLDNRIHHIGEVFPNGIGIYIFRSGKNTISHNEIHDTYYSGIGNGWSWGYEETNAGENIIEYNHIYNIGRGMMTDMGGIYNVGLQHGTIIRNNLFHDISSYDYGGWGIYPDEGTTGILIENNVVYNTKTGGFYQHFGKENIIRNNIFAFSLQGQVVRGIVEEHLSFSFTGNIVYWKESPLYDWNWGISSDYKYHDKDSFKSLKKAKNTTPFYFMDNNCFWKVGGEPFDFAGLTLDEWRARGQDINSIIADPKFVDPENYNFTLADDSPAFALGFKQIDLSEVGPRR